VKPHETWPAFGSAILTTLLWARCKSAVTTSPYTFIVVLMSRSPSTFAVRLSGFPQRRARSERCAGGNVFRNAELRPSVPPSGSTARREGTRSAACRPAAGWRRSNPAHHRTACPAAKPIHIRPTQRQGFTDAESERNAQQGQRVNWLLKVRQEFAELLLPSSYVASFSSLHL